jgi:SAM-dependent methyltransferase
VTAETPRADYDRIAASWIPARRDLPPRDAALIDDFMARLPASGRVLDLGCGTGRPIAMQLAERGFALHGVDRSAALLAEARRNVPGATFEQADVASWPMTGRWDGIVIFDVLFHLPRAIQEQIIARARTALDPGGLLLLTAGGSSGDVGPFTDTMFGAEFWYDAFPRAELVRRCVAIGFKVEVEVLLNEPDGGRDKGRLGLLLTRTAER